MSGLDTKLALGTPDTAGIHFNTVPRVSMPKHLDWHMILDQELSHLTRPEMGHVSSLALVALGAAVGFFPQFLTIWSRLGAEPISRGDAAILITFAATATFAIAGNIIYAIWHRRNKGLADEIRKRPKFWQEDTRPDTNLDGGDG